MAIGKSPFASFIYIYTHIQDYIYTASNASRPQSYTLRLSVKDLRDRRPAHIVKKSCFIERAKKTKMAFILDLLTIRGISMFLATLQLFHLPAMSIIIEKITPAYELSEGPHWDIPSQKLYFVDITAQKIMRLDPATGKITSAYLENGPVGVAIPVEGKKDKLVAGCGTDIVLVTWDGESDVTNPPIEKLTSLDTDRNDTRINDGKCDPAGRFWLGTMGKEINNVIQPNRGTLYTLSNDLILKTVLTPVSISNGLAWSLQNDTMYYIDSMTLQVSAFDYNIKDGTATNKRVVFDLKTNNVTGLPDGMTIDSDGNLWIALFNGKAVIQVDPKSGKLLRTVSLPVDKITSVAFGGAELDILYVTSASIGLTAEEKKKNPNFGSLYAIKDLGVRGCPPTNFKYSS